MTSRKRWYLFVIPSVFLLLLLISGCTLWRSMRARKLLSKCRYSLEKVALKTFDFIPVIAFDNRKNTFSIEKPSVDLVPLLDDIRKKKFNLKVNSLTFTVYIQITNPNKQEVEIDSMFFKGFLDDQFAATIVHREHTIIPSGKKKTIKLFLNVPVTVSLDKIKTAKEIILNGKVWLKLAVVGKNSLTIPFTVTIKKEIPRKKLEMAIEKKKSEIVRSLLKGIHRDAPSLIDKGKELFEKIF